MLTPQQLAIVRLLAQGYEYEEIGRALFISPSTVKKHVEVARNRVGARNKVHLVAMACTGAMLDEVSA